MAVAGQARIRPSFEQEIKPLFRQRDVRAMAFAFDLHGYEDVVANRAAILARLEDGTMPCDGPWPAEQLALFRAWIDDGTPR
jgi:hypothetical protein